MKRIILLLYVLIIVKGYSQGEYKLILNEQGIQVFAKEIECHDNQNGIHQAFYALQFINNTNKNIVVSWNIDYWMNGACITCNKPKTAENTCVLQLLPGQSIEGTCDKTSPKGTRVYIRELNNSKTPVLSKFEIVNLNINIQ